MDKSSADKDFQREFRVRLDHLQKTVNTLQTRLAKSTKEHEEAKFKMIKVIYKTEHDTDVSLTNHYGFKSISYNY